MARQKGQRSRLKGSGAYGECKTPHQKENVARLGDLWKHHKLVDDLLSYLAMQSEADRIAKAPKNLGCITPLWEPDAVRTHSANVESLVIKALRNNDAEFFESLAKCLRHIGEYGAHPRYPRDLALLRLQKANKLPIEPTIRELEELLESLGIKSLEGTVRDVSKRIGLKTWPAKRGRKKNAG